jgi:NitT/TauT family transport system permease protein
MRAPRSATLWTVTGAVALFGIWELLVRILDVRPYVLLPPSRAVETFFDTPGFYLDHAWITARHLLVGLAISLAFGLLVGALLTSSRIAEYASQPLLVLIMVTPWVAYITSVGLIVGLGEPAVLFLTAFVTIPPFVYGTVGGMRGADAAARELFASVNASRWEVLFRLRLPSAMPALFTAARFNVGLGLAATYFAEGSTGSQSGLGHWGKRAAASNMGPLLWTTILCTAALGLLALLLVAVAERWLLRWHVSQRSTNL